MTYLEFLNLPPWLFLLIAIALGCGLFPLFKEQFSTPRKHRRNKYWWEYLILLAMSLAITAFAMTHLYQKATGLSFLNP